MMNDSLLATAYHEAAHTVVAYLSSFHSPIGRMRLLTADTGDTLVSLSKSKLRETGKDADVSAQQDPEVRMEFALVQLAGFATEVRLHSRGSDSGQKPEPDRSLSANDYAEAKSAVGIEALPTIEYAALETVEMHWAAIDRLARLLLRHGELDAIEAIDILDGMYRLSG